ncbi:hypothetical protein IV37_GL000166 [Fructilactobacillus fructivorans]|nr:hypothetical protein IV37_GL000166 [Fructilactobacillus fructivorans]
MNGYKVEIKKAKYIVVFPETISNANTSYFLARRDNPNFQNQGYYIKEHRLEDNVLEDPDCLFTGKEMNEMPKVYRKLAKEIEYYD